MISNYSPGPKDFRKESCVGVQWQKPHQDSWNPPKPHFLDIPDIPDHPDGDKKSWKRFQTTPLVPGIPERYHVWGCNDKKPIKTPEILQNPSFLDIPDIPDHPDGDKKSWKQFLTTPLVPGISERYHVWGYNDKNPTKTTEILPNPRFSLKAWKCIKYRL